MDDATLRTLPDDPAQLKQIILNFAKERDVAARQCDTVTRQRDELLNRNQELELAKIRLEHKLLAALKRLYGPRADRVMQEADVAQLLLDFARELEARPINTDDIPADADLRGVDEKTIRRVRRRRGRRDLSADEFDHLPVIRKEHDLSDADKPCPCCAKQREQIGAETSWQIEYIPGSFTRVEHVRIKYACKHCGQGCDHCDGKANIELADKPIQPIEKGMAGPGLLAFIVTSKFADYRVQGKAMSKMRGGLSQPGYRIRLQTSSNCGGKEPSWETSSQKARQRSRQVRSAKTNASEPLKKCRKLKDDAKTGTGSCPGNSVSDTCLRLAWHPAQRRRERGSGLDTEPWNLSPRCKERSSSGQNREGESINAGHRGGTTRSSDEGRVMRPERRGRVIQFLANESTPGNQRRNL